MDDATEASSEDEVLEASEAQLWAALPRKLRSALSASGGVQPEDAMIAFAVDDADVPHFLASLSCTRLGLLGLRVQPITGRE